MDLRTIQALSRFGLGIRAGEPPPSDPEAWLLRQLKAPDPIRLDDPPSTAKGLNALREDREHKLPPGQSRSAALFRAEGMAQMAHAVTTPAPFRERLVWFWTNHFTVSRRNGACAPLIGAFVQEAVRPHVTGRFADMLLAVIRHPAMLLYLNNAWSVGPDSPLGRRTHRGLNENLARECMELHTVSPAAGYTQADVTNFARILTGWSIDMKANPPGFRFRPFAHEPGVLTLMGRHFPPGEAGGTEALAYLANHPSTHRFLATKLARHFIADNPPPDAIRRIETVLRDTGGDLGATSAALVTLPQAWRPGTKLRTPSDYVVAALRALDVQPDSMPGLLWIMADLGQPIWAAPAPNGWSDKASAWAAPEAMLRRIDFAHHIAPRARHRDVLALADNALGPLLRPATRAAMRDAASRPDAVTLMLTSPEFHRR